MYGEDREVSLVPPENETPATSRAARAATEVGLPPLEGPEAEVTQAVEIRAGILMDADDILTGLRSDQILTEEQKDTAITTPRIVSHAQVTAAQVALNRLRHQTEASWWIARQGRAAVDLLREFGSEE